MAKYTVILISSWHLPRTLAMPTICWDSIKLVLRFVTLHYETEWQCLRANRFNLVKPLSRPEVKVLYYQLMHHSKEIWDCSPWTPEPANRPLQPSLRRLRALPFPPRVAARPQTRTP